MRDLIPLNATCAGCRWFNPIDDTPDIQGWGNCRRYAMGGKRGDWPLVHGPKDICGEWNRNTRRPQ